jgi:hypothetical protein
MASSELESNCRVYQLEDAVGMDLDELKGQGMQRSFMLGAEWCLLRIAFMTLDSRRLEKAIHTNNINRVRTLAEKYGWHAEFVPGGTGWCTLVAMRLGVRADDDDADPGDEEGAES